MIDTVPRPIRMDRIIGTEVLWLGLAAVFLTANSLDALREIPPLADDYWMMARAPGEIAREYLRDYGWGRFIGMWVLDLVNTLRAATGVSLVAVVVAVRVATLVAIYVTLRRLFAFSPGVALLSVGLMAWNPPATETWVLLCNLHLAVSVVPVLIACGLYARAFGELKGVGERESDVISGEVPWRVVGAAVAVQVVANFIYEQALLSVPAFVVALSLFGRAKKLTQRSKIAVLGAAIGAVIVSVLVLVATGYVSGRSQGAPSESAQLTDVRAALYALWVGFGEHHLWRLVEAIRTQQVFWWDKSLVGAVAGFATVAASVLIGFRLVSDRTVRASQPNRALAVASLFGAYAALLLMGFAFPGYRIVSRLYYVPGAFLGVAVGALAPTGWGLRRLALGVGAAGALMWLGSVTRRYYEDMRQGARILRIVARAVARLPSNLRDNGVLVIAPSNTGTFSTGVVEPWSLRPAVRMLTGVNPGGPLLMAADCSELTREPPRIAGDDGHPHRWAVVLRYSAGKATSDSTVTAACARG